MQCVAMRLDDDSRFLATTENDDLIARLTDGDPLGRPVFVRSFDFGNRCALGCPKLPGLCDRGDQPLSVRNRYGERRVVTQTEDAMDRRLEVDAHAGLGVGAKSQSVVDHR